MSPPRYPRRRYRLKRLERLARGEQEPAPDDDVSSGIQDPTPMTLAERDAADVVWERASWSSRLWHAAADRIWDAAADRAAADRRKQG